MLTPQHTVTVIIAGDIYEISPDTAVGHTICFLTRPHAAYYISAPTFIYARCASFKAACAHSRASAADIQAARERDFGALTPSCAGAWLAARNIAARNRICKRRVAEIGDEGRAVGPGPVRAAAFRFEYFALTRAAECTADGIRARRRAMGKRRACGICYRSMIDIYA